MSDGTFGYSTIGASKLGPSQNKMYGSKFTSPSDIGTITDLRHAICSDIGTGKFFKAVIVLASTGAIVTNGVSNATELPYSAGQVPSWATCTFSTPPTLSPNTDYILYIIHSDPDWSNYSAYDTGSANQYYFDSSNSYASPTDPTDAVNTGDDNGGPNTAKLSVYITYTNSSGYSVAWLIA